jgi:hypothetical protein
MCFALYVAYLDSELRHAAKYHFLPLFFLPFHFYLHLLLSSYVTEVYKKHLRLH